MDGLGAIGITTLVGLGLLAGVSAWRLLGRRRARPAMAVRAPAGGVLLLWFAGCPHAGGVRTLLDRLRVPFAEVRQDALPAGHPQRGYTSPTLLAPDGTVLWGSASGELGCSLLPPEPAALEDALRRAGLLTA